ncbi:hypothetical protein [Roseovarius indicus]|uniref:Uncharacterized protein n=1 Tax=Roseovarius indicus TaxID=540747 RepID=A0A0T5P3A1_9RHOB|nr:hypothetical protein [Roseovarius indicus]KRS15645.1 hypothetical protein XM52_22665 [Roseovarius indicus]QEW27845.1 hypothetical protein RIdsm_03666 [Roseovarius indicus]SFE79349.1 hypothetical protein SAMN04488031_12221 [Roseovarius indicus]
MTDDLPHASTLQVMNCTQDCPCQSVHVWFYDDDGEPYAAACLLPHVARKIARDMSDAADLAEAVALKNEGRLS